MVRLGVIRVDVPRQHAYPHHSKVVGYKFWIYWISSVDPYYCGCCVWLGAWVAITVLEGGREEKRVA